MRRVLDNIRMRTSRIGRATQARWGLIVANKIVSDSRATATKTTVYAHPTGQTLFNIIPPDMCDYVTNSSFDPYRLDMTKEQIRSWLWDHVIFDPSGQIIAVHNSRTTLFVEEDWHAETDWFIRVKDAEQRKVQRNG